MRIVLLGVSHWHTPFYLDPLLDMPDVTVVGVSDPNPARAEEIAAKARCPSFVDYREMCTRQKPDFAFALGRHCDMADEARFLIYEHIPFAIEKPCAVAATDARDIAARAARAGLFAAVTFVIRYSPLIEAISEVAAGEALSYILSKFVGGMVDRYHEQRVDWMLQRATAGGGPLLNLGVHFLDLCHVLLPDTELRVVGSAMSNHFSHLDIEDHAVVLIARRQRNLHGGDWLSLSRPELGFRSSLLNPDRRSLFCGARQPDTGNSRQRPPARGAIDTADQLVLLPIVRCRYFATARPWREADCRPRRYGQGDGAGRGCLRCLAAHSARTGASMNCTTGMPGKRPSVIGLSAGGFASMLVASEEQV